MAEALKARPAIIYRRRAVVELPFGGIKQWMYQEAFLSAPGLVTCTAPVQPGLYGIFALLLRRAQHPRRQAMTTR